MENGEGVSGPWWGVQAWEQMKESRHLLGVEDMLEDQVDSKDIHVLEKPPDTDPALGVQVPEKGDFRRERKANEG